MKAFKKIAGINLLALLAYSLLIRIANWRSMDDILIESAVVIILHVMLCLICTAVEFSARRNENGRAWAWSSGIVLLVGFSTCLGNASLG